ncbi:MAG: hypothetical protein FJ147_07375 [Deltaproteobacteria bacterium]|nr:hypothetical protein [Deltaproteobacteria bacterium]
MAIPFDEHSVFLNVPYDKAYEPLFITLVASIASLGLTPRCVLEISEIGQGRLARIQELMESCRVSVHDLSRVGMPVRFNMPFELGLACSIARLNGHHEVIVLERHQYRLDKTLSDYKGRDPQVHYGRCDALVGCILDTLVTGRETPDPETIRTIAKDLRKTAPAIKKKHGRDLIFHRGPFQALVGAALQLAREKELIT